MRIAVLAAGGRSGQAFVHEALAAGHHVRAGIHGSDPFEPHANLVTVECDATNRDEVTKLIERCDAVVSLIGHVKGSPTYVQRDAMQATVTAMEASGINRLVSLTGVGVGTRHGWLLRPLAVMAELMGRVLNVDRLRDGIAHAQVLERSNLNWTVIKVLLLSDGAPGSFNVKSHGIVKAPTPRREVARAILQVLRDESFVRDYPILTR